MKRIVKDNENVKPIITFLIKNTYQLQLYRRRLRQI